MPDHDVSPIRAGFDIFRWERELWLGHLGIN